jgi:pimeloyl-ACP methyl ester carboxylesterase
MSDETQTQVRREIVAWAALGTTLGLTSLALANRLIAMSSGEFYNVLGGEEGRYAWEQGDVFYTVRGRGAPLLLIHGVYAGASSFEYRRVFESLARDFRVYAMDLLGFGLSDRPNIVYTPQLYIRLIEDFTRQVMGGADNPVQVVASTLSAAFTIHAMADRPSLFERAVFIEPTGLETLNTARATLDRQVARQVLRLPLVGETIYNVVASRASIRRFLTKRTYAPGAAVSDELVDYYYLAAHQQGARYPLASFLSGTLDTPVNGIYQELRQPILLAWGKDARITPLEQARAFRQSNPRAEIRVFDSGALPQDELPEEFVSEVSAWLRMTSGSRRRL